MFILYANKNQLAVRKKEHVTSGSVNVYEALFEFSADWDGLTRTAVFKAGAESRAVLLDESGQCVIPWEVLSSHGRQLTAGVYGTLGGEIVLPTIWADLGTILEGVTVGEAAQPPTPDLWEQELAQKQDRLTGLPGQFVGFDENGDAIAQNASPGGGDGGTDDHRLLTHRDAESQHPIAAIDGLKEALEQIPVPMTADQLRKILKSKGD